MQVNPGILSTLELNHGSIDDIPPDLFTVFGVLGFKGISHVWDQQGKVDLSLHRVAVVRFLGLMNEVNLEDCHVDDGRENNQSTNSGSDVFSPLPLIEGTVSRDIMVSINV